MRRTLVLLGFFIALSAPAAAQETARTFTPSHLAAARELTDAVNVRGATAAGIEIMMETQIEANPAMAPYRAVMLDWARDIFSSDEAQDAFSRLYAELFPEEDLRALTAFFRTPVGRRLADSQGSLARRGAEVGRKLAEANQADLMARLAKVKP
ncbi:MAG: DUF2059 domain-containing protein [Gemmatimonadetes bacterium]|nr:DUF2059 domain-containing protein [Gemmatimonadota bacterium]